MSMLIITNGDSAAEAISQAGIESEILPWRDVLHDGPVPAGLKWMELAQVRARFLAEVCHWGDFEKTVQLFMHQYEKIEQFSRYQEIVLWFEHDLYDQLQLLQMLHYFASKKSTGIKLSLVCNSRYIAEMPLEKLKTDFKNRRKVTDAQLQLGKSAWNAFTSPYPEKMLPFIKKKSEELPFLSSAFLRFLQEYPDFFNGLSRTERQILLSVGDQIETPVTVFRTAQKMEEAKYLGDWSFWRYMGMLINGDHPLLTTVDREKFIFPPFSKNENRFFQQRIVLTERGKAVLLNQEDWVRLNGIDKWLGGAHLHKNRFWRWHKTEKRLIKD